MTASIPLPPIDETLFAQHRVFRVDYAGGRLWAKYGGKNYANGFLKFMGALSGDEGGTLAREVKAIRALRADGFLVPEVLAQTETYMLLSDIGPVLHVLAREADAGTRRTFVVEAAQALRRLHDAGHWHGAAALKNMTRHAGQVGFIDFESAMHRYIGVRATQLLDVWQLACSVAYFDTEGTLVPDYFEAYGHSGARRILRILALPLLPLALLLRPFTRKLPRDVRQPVRALCGLYRL